jgi:CsoR family transcriptional regulator, copper-sensing transcriptional repressor
MKRAGTAAVREDSKMDHGSHETGRALALLKTARGQIDGVLRMVEEDRYCIDVSKQVLATIALLKKANLVILKQHMDTCVKDAIRTDKGAEKIDEITLILEKYLGK